MTLVSLEDISGKELYEHKSYQPQSKSKCLQLSLLTKTYHILTSQPMEQVEELENTLLVFTWVVMGFSVRSKGIRNQLVLYFSQVVVPDFFSLL